MHPEFLNARFVFCGRYCRRSLCVLLDPSDTFSVLCLSLRYRTRQKVGRPSDLLSSPLVLLVRPETAIFPWIKLTILGLGDIEQDQHFTSALPFCTLDIFLVCLTHRSWGWILPVWVVTVLRSNKRFSTDLFYFGDIVSVYAVVLVWDNMCSTEALLQKSSLEIFFCDDYSVSEAHLSHDTFHR